MGGPLISGPGKNLGKGARKGALAKAARNPDCVRKNPEKREGVTGKS